MASAIANSFVVKILVIGDSGVGKSCMLLRYSDDEFTGSYISTIGIDFKIKTVTLEGKLVKLQIWDTAGQERFRNITSAYYRGSMGVLLVYDISDKKSFQNVSNWMRQIELNASPDVNTTLVGNKCDVEEGQRKVTYEQGRSLAAEYGVRFLETSARSDINITNAFEGLATDVIHRLQAADQAWNPALKLTKEEAKLPSTKAGRSINECC